MSKKFTIKILSMFFVIGIFCALFFAPSGLVFAESDNYHAACQKIESVVHYNTSVSEGEDAIKTYEDAIKEERENDKNFKEDEGARLKYETLINEKAYYLASENIKKIGDYDGENATKEVINKYSISKMPFTNAFLQEFLDNEAESKYKTLLSQKTNKENYDYSSKEILKIEKYTLQNKKQSDSAMSDYEIKKVALLTNVTFGEGQLNIEAEEKYAVLNSQKEYINSFTYLEKPSFNNNEGGNGTGTYTYDGTPHTFMPLGFEGQYMEIEGNENHTNAGEYDVKISLKDTSIYKWKDGLTDPIILKAQILKAQKDMSKVVYKSQKFIYTGESYELQPPSNLPAGVSYFYGEKRKEKDPGVYVKTVYFTLEAGEELNFKEIPPMSATLTINPVQLSSSDKEIEISSPNSIDSQTLSCKKITTNLENTLTGKNLKAKEGYKLSCVYDIEVLDYEGKRIESLENGKIKIKLPKDIFMFDLKVFVARKLNSVDLVDIKEIKEYEIKDGYIEFSSNIIGEVGFMTNQVIPQITLISLIVAGVIAVASLIAGIVLIVLHLKRERRERAAKEEEYKEYFSTLETRRQAQLEEEEKKSKKTSKKSSTKEEKPAAKKKDEENQTKKKGRPKKIEE